MNTTNLKMLAKVAFALGDMCDEVVFIGGATVELYATNTAAPESRPTIDVDCIIEIASLKQSGDLEAKLRSKGFRNDQSVGAPICRWVFDDTIVDIMDQVDGHGFNTNPWYDKGFKHTVNYILNENLKINILDVAYFIATKLTALLDRGINDLRLSKDFDDLVYLLHNRTNIVSELNAVDSEVMEFIKTSFKIILGKDVIDEAISAVLSLGEPKGTARKLKLIMESIVS